MPDRDDGIFWLNEAGLVAGAMNRYLSGNTAWPHERYSPAIIRHWYTGVLNQYERPHTPYTGEYQKLLAKMTLPAGWQCSSRSTEQHDQINIRQLLANFSQVKTPHDMPGRLYWQMAAWKYDVEEYGGFPVRQSSVNPTAGSAAFWGGGLVRTDGGLDGLNSETAWIFQPARRPNWQDVSGKTTVPLYLYVYQLVLDELTTADRWDRPQPDSSYGRFYFRSWGYRSPNAASNAGMAWFADCCSVQRSEWNTYFTWKEPASVGNGQAPS